MTDQVDWNRDRQEWNRNYDRASLATVDDLIKQATPSDFVTRNSLEQHRDELAARIASAEPPRATDSPPAAEPDPLRPMPHHRTQAEIDALFEARWLVVPAEESENDGPGRGMWSSKPTEEDAS